MRDVVLAHGRAKRITLRRVWDLMGLTGHCEMCGASTDGWVVYLPDARIVEACAACRGDANVSEGN